MGRRGGLNHDLYCDMSGTIIVRDTIFSLLQIFL